MTRISICIPIYNQDVKVLAEELLRQTSNQPLCEIIFMDDGSSSETLSINQWMKSEPGIGYFELGKNVGRAAIRNRLAAKANGDNILFLDDDSLIENPNFIKNYLEAIDNESVICGGRTYTPKLMDRKYALHWKYGSKIESKSAEERNEAPYESFHSNNFIIPKKVWNEVPFDENLTQYGHEDTLLGFELSHKEYPVRHINNSVIHGQLETNAEFLAKTKMALQNLNVLYHRGNGDFNDSVKLLRTFDHLDQYSGITIFLEKLYLKNGKRWEEKLANSRRPSLRLFGLYKLCYLSHLMHTSPKFSSK